jgi:hypothetical protein
MTGNLGLPLHFLNCCFTMLEEVIEFSFRVHANCSFVDLSGK